MKSREHSAAKLDVEAFARDGGQLQGQWPAVELERLAETAAPEAPASAWPGVSWSLEGELRERRGAEPEVWLHLSAAAEVQLTCQRCLHAVSEQIQVERSILFVRGEDEAANLDADSDDDVLALTRNLDVKALVEEELLLELPLVPRHEVCPTPLAAPVDDLPEEQDKPHPFAALAALKKK